MIEEKKEVFIQPSTRRNKKLSPLHSSQEQPQIATRKNSDDDFQIIATRKSKAIINRKQFESEAEDNIEKKAERPKLN